MKKSNFVALILGTISMVLFALGMCAALLPEWNLFRQGVISGIAGIILMIVTLIVWRRMEGKEPIRLSAKTVGSVVVGILGALLLGVGMCLCMVFNHMLLGIIIGVIGIVVLLMLIPLTKGLHD